MKAKAVKVIETEDKEFIAADAKVEVEEMLAGLLFESWLNSIMTRN